MAEQEICELCERCFRSIDGMTDYEIMPGVSKLDDILGIAKPSESE